MTKEEKELLLKDLCARLPYGVRMKGVNEDFELSTSTSPKRLSYVLNSADFKLYLRPMSSMTAEEFSEYYNIKYNKITYRDNYKRIDVGKFHNVGIIPIEEYIDWLNSHHFDYRGLIEKGLALEAPKDMYN